MRHWLSVSICACAVLLGGCMELPRPFAHRGPVMQNQLIELPSGEGVRVVVADGLDPELAGALRVLAGRGHEILFLQILSREDLDPDLEGDLRLVDVEGGPPVEVTANSSVLRDYKSKLESHNADLRDTILRVGGRTVSLRPDDDLEQVVSKTWKPQGWVA